LLNFCFRFARTNLPGGKRALAKATSRKEKAALQEQIRLMENGAYPSMKPREAQELAE
jgi:hypothetical protein